MSNSYEWFRYSSCKNIFFEKDLPRLFDLNRSLNSKFENFFEILNKIASKKYLFFRL
jgi:hypothetical protein